MPTDPRDAIADLEDEIARLAVGRERCRKLSYAAKAAVLAGAALLVAPLTGLVGLTPSLLLGALAAIIGGVVLLGSNARSWDDIEAALRKREAQRADLIGSLALRVVDPGVRWLQ